MSSNSKTLEIEVGGFQNLGYNGRVRMGCVLCVHADTCYLILYRVIFPST